MVLQQVHERIPAFRQMMYGKDKAKYVPSSYTQAQRRQRIFAMLKQSDLVVRKREYAKFVKDIRSYDYRQPKDAGIYADLSENLDFKDMKASFPRNLTYLCYDEAVVGRKGTYKVYLVRYDGLNFVCAYKSGRYFDNSMIHPNSKLLLCLPFR